MAKLGHIERIDNKDRPKFSNARKTYLAGILRNCVTGGKHFMMFTDRELSPKVDVVVEGIALKLGHVYPITQGNRKTYLVFCTIEGKNRVVKLSESKMKVAYKRTCNNPEDVQEQDFWDKLFN